VAREGPGGLAGMANAYGRSLEVRECKFYDQSGGLIQRRCATALTAEKSGREREKERERERERQRYVYSLKYSNRRNGSDALVGVD